jgi:hypothetical protein
MIKSLSLLLAGLVLWVTGLHAQAHLVEGYLYVAERNAPLAFANVWLKNQQVGRVKNAQGYFKIPISGHDTLVASYIGYESKTMLIDLFIMISILSISGKMKEGSNNN